MDSGPGEAQKVPAGSSTSASRDPGGRSLLSKPRRITTRFKAKIL